MTLSGQEIQRNLSGFVRRWASYGGGERAEAQTFVNELFACYGSDRRAAGARFESGQPRPDGARGFVDALWPERCLIEMKPPTEAGRLASHRRQALDYWRHSAEEGLDRGAVPYVVLCAFSAFEVWEPGRFPLNPRAVFPLEELADRYDALLFLARQPPLFAPASRRLTTEAAQRTVDLYRMLVDRQAAAVWELQSFILQAVWTLFASSLGVVEGRPVQRIVTGLLRDEQADRSSAAEVVFRRGCSLRLGARSAPASQGATSDAYLKVREREATPRGGMRARLQDQRSVPFGTLGHLFGLFADEELRGRGGVYEHAVYVNGGLFQLPAKVHLRRAELELLAEMAAYDWGEVAPTIFGSLLEGFLPRQRAIASGGARTQFGVHYTHESDIAKIVVPTIVEPWTQRIEAASTVDEAEAALADLCRFRVLDPACGSGNFLFVAYRELRQLERLARERIDELAVAAGLAPPDPARLPRYPLTNLYGIELDPFAVQVSRLVLWMGHKLAADRHGTPEPPLPLPDLETNIRKDDALLLDWPEVDAVIGNPPFNGSQHLRRDLGEAYLKKLKRTFGCGVRDYCTYFFRKTAEHLPAGGRAGLVGTNSVAQGRGREAALDYVIEQGGLITDAVSSQKWPGDAKVHVCIVNWVQRPPSPPERFELDGGAVPGGIAPDLLPTPLSTIQAACLNANQNVCFQGPIPVGDGFIIDEAEASSLFARDEADYREVVRPYLVGDDLTEDPLQRPRRWIIDFALMPLEGAQQFPAALRIVRERVKPKRDHNSRPGRRERWWRFGEVAVGMRAALAARCRYLAVGATGKRTLLSWCEPQWCPSNLLYAIALDSDYAFGVLSSRPHALWAHYRGSTLETRRRYTNTTVFDTFPWPAPERATRERIADAARMVLLDRAKACEEVRGLTEVYNTMDEGGFRGLAAAHRQLDEAVAAAYGWPGAIVDDPYEVIPRLLRLNTDISAGRISYRPFSERDPASEAAPRFDFGGL